MQSLLVLRKWNAGRIFVSIPGNHYPRVHAILGLPNILILSQRCVGTLSRVHTPGKAKLPEHIWLELTRTYIPIRQMSTKRSHSRTSHALSVNRNCMFFLHLVRKCHVKDDINISSTNCIRNLLWFICWNKVFFVNFRGKT